MAVKTLYTVLGVESTASAENIEDAFLRCKARYPQSKLAVDDTARNQFQALRQAHETLSNPDSRALYDQKLARVGIPVARMEGQDPGGSLTRNIVVGGVILLLGSGMWVYYAHEKAQAEKEIADRALAVIEEKRRHDAELADQDAQRRQILFEDSQHQREEVQARQFQMEAQRTGQQASINVQRAQQQADAAQRRAEQDQQRADALVQRQAQQDAARRLADDKRQLRALCLQRYGRPDC
jgi:curved DNA-binding protein CbpA